MELTFSSLSKCFDNKDSGFGVLETMRYPPDDRGDGECKVGVVSRGTIIYHKEIIYNKTIPTNNKRIDPPIRVLAGAECECKERLL